MPKFYIFTADQKTIVTADSSDKAFRKGLRRIIEDNDHPQLGTVTCASERGFDMKCKHGDTIVIMTGILLRDLGNLGDGEYEQDDDCDCGNCGGGCE